MRRREFLPFLPLPLLSPVLLPALLPALAPTLARAASGPTVPYPAVTPDRQLVFPADHGAHPNFRTEWWYLTGALQTADATGRESADFGFQLTFFRTRPGQAEALDSPLAARQILFAHAAVSRPGAGLQHAERAARAGLGAGYSTTDCTLHLGNWRLERRGEGADEHFSLAVRDPAFAFELELAPTEPLLLQGDHGYSRKGPHPAQASYYVSWPQLEARGTLVHGGRRHQVRGRAWFDHEWSSQLLAPGSVGWDWIGINLDGGGALMAFRIRNAAGATVFAHAALRDAKGNLQQFADVDFKPLRSWASPRNGARYPVETELRFGPHSIRTTPLFDDQELTSRRPRPVSYWEGLVTISGTLSGRGYLELTGYAEAMAL